MAETKEIFVLTQMSEFDKSYKIDQQTDIIALQEGRNVRIDSEVIAQQVINKVNPKFIERKEKGQPNGVATLDENGKVPSTQLPPLDFTVNEIPIDKTTASPTQNGVFIPTQIGVYPNFGDLEYTQQEFDNNDDVRFIFIYGRYEKQVKSFVVEGEINSSDTRAVGGNKIYNYTLKEVKTITDLRNLIGEEEQTVRLLGYYEAGDKPPLLYKWISGSGEDDGGSVIASTGGYWEALFDTKDLDILHFGAKYDGIYDNTSCFQKILDLGYNVVVSSDKALVTDTIILRKNTSVKGISISNPKWTENISGILFYPSSKKDLFKSDIIQTGYGYIAGIEVSNLTIKGNINSRYCLNLKNVANSVFKNIYTDSFDTALYADTLMNVGFDLCNFSENRENSIHFVGGISTTTVFNKCYMHFSKRVGILEHNTCLGITFIDTIFESCEDMGLDIHTDNVVDFVNLYTENIPRTKKGNVPIIQIGVNGKEKNTGYPTGKSNFVGGNIAGCNFGIDADSLILKTDKVSIVSFYGTSFNRANRLIDKTNNTKLITLDSPSFFEISNFRKGIENAENVNISRIVNINNASNTYEAKGFRFLGRSEWVFEDLFRNTDSDLELKNKNKTVIGINNLGSVTFGGNDNLGNATNIFKVKDSNDDFTGIDYSGGSLYYSKKDINGMSHFMTRDSSGQEYICDGVMVIANAAKRPIYNYKGRTIFQDDIHKNITWDGAKWRDQNGVEV